MEALAGGPKLIERICAEVSHCACAVICCNGLVGAFWPLFGIHDGRQGV